MNSREITSALLETQELARLLGLDRRPNALDSPPILKEHLRREALLKATPPPPVLPATKRKINVIVKRKSN